MWGRFAARVQKVQKGRFLSLTGPFGPRVVVAADAADYKRGARLRRRLCRRVVFASLKGRRPFGPRVVDCPTGNAYKVSVTGLAVCVIWHDKHSGD